MRFVIEIPDELFLAGIKQANENGVQGDVGATPAALSGGAAPDVAASTGAATVMPDALSAGEANYGGVTAVSDRSADVLNGGAAPAST